MMLMDVRDYLQRNQQATLSDMALHFDVPEGAMQDMVEQWVRKGRVIITQDAESCSSGGCSGCHEGGCGSSIGKTLYRWRERF